MTLAILAAAGIQQHGFQGRAFCVVTDVVGSEEVKAAVSVPSLG